jgi:putative membrane protein
MGLLVRWVINAVALWVTTLVVPGITVSGSTRTRYILTLVIVALIFGLVNAIIKPLIQVVGCVFYVLTLGLISFVVNALLFLLVGWLAQKLHLMFVVNGFWAAFWGAIVMAVVSWALSLLVPDRMEAAG